MTLEGCLFDLDGTLIVQRLDFPAIRAELGVPASEGILHHIDTLPYAEREVATTRLREIERAAAAEATAAEGLDALCAWLSERAMPFGVITRNSREAARESLARVGLDPAVVIAREDAPPKPDPAGVHAAARTIGVTAGALALIGDYVDDIRAGVAAGCCATIYLINHRTADSSAASSPHERARAIAHREALELANHSAVTLADVPQLLAPMLARR